MKIEAGKYYKTKSGKKVGPAVKEREWFDLSGFGYFQNGERMAGVESDNLVSEWPVESPVRTVTRKEIVPGVYDIISVPEGPHPIGRVLIHMDRSSRGATPSELRAAAATMTELADALENPDA